MCLLCGEPEGRRSLRKWNCCCTSTIHRYYSHLSPPIVKREGDRQAAGLFPSASHALDPHPPPRATSRAASPNKNHNELPIPILGGSTIVMVVTTHVRQSVRATGNMETTEVPCSTASHKTNTGRSFLLLLLLLLETSVCLGMYTRYTKIK